MAFSDISIKWKIIAISITGTILVAVLMGFQRIGDIRSGATKGILEKSRAIVLMAEAGRNEMSKKLELGIIRPFDQLEKSKIMEAVPVITALNMAAENAEAAHYRFKAPKNSPRNPKNEPDDLEKKVLQELKDRNLPEKIVYESDNIRYFKPIRLTQECLYCHGDPAGDRDPTGGIKEGWKEGDIRGAFEIISSLEEANAAVLHAQLTVAGMLAVILIIICGVVFFMIRQYLLTPLGSSMELISAIGNGDLTQSIDLHRQDEFGRMILQMNEMSASLRKMVRNIDERSETILNGAHELSDISNSLAQGAASTADRSNAVAAATEEMSVNMASVAAAMEEAATNVGMVASAAEEMTNTIHGIARNSETARGITSTAVSEAERASQRVHELGAAAKEIGRVTEAITEISEQTNLLALNATIEAARAGDAGKGFAVVANEIKELARQTSQATEEIKKKVSGIQTSTGQTVSEIENITGIINKINDIVATTATAVEEQSVTTREIASNVAQASQGIQEVNENVAQSSQVAGEIAKDITEVNHTASGITDASSLLNNSSEEMAGLAKDLKALVENFKV